ILRNWKAPKLPAALYAWACAATGPLVGGEGWYESEPWEARQGLADWWDIRSGEDAAATVSELLRGPVTAWSRVRAIHVAIAACRCELLGPEWTWQAVLHAARELQQSYPSFDAIASDYLRARREWARLPVDGTADDAQQRGCVARVAALQKRRWDGVPFDAFLHV
ncbi:MAG: DUF1266 domain-containing protein, partial [Kofleriaceae bacterium]|nr:DUF1266 domain-containing protein [Kofleriaceae bacterium]